MISDDMPTVSQRSKKRQENSAAAGYETTPPIVNGQEPKEPAPPTTTFWEFLFGLGDRWQKEGLSLYIYRLWPVTDTRNPERFLCKLHEAVDEDWILKNFGSGKYWLLLNDDKGKNLRKLTINPHNPDHPPRVAREEVVESDPLNRVYFEVWAKQGSKTDKAHEASSIPSDINTVLTTVLEKSRSFDPGLAQMWERTAKERDELSKALAEKNAPRDLLAMVKSIKELFPAAPGAPTPQVDVLSIIAALKSMQPAPSDPLATLAQVQQILASQQQANPAATDDFTRFEKFLSVADRLASFRKGDSGRTGWDVGLDFARELGPTVISPLLNIVNNAMLLRVQARGGPGAASAAGAAAPPMPSSFDPYKDAAAMRSYSQAQRQPEPPRPSAMPTAATGAPPAAPAANPTPIADTPAAAPQPDNQVTQLLAAYGGLLVSAINNGTSGADFADWLAQGFGMATHAMIAGHGEAALAQSMLAVPDLAIFGEARLRKFAFEFVHYDEILSAEEGDEETPDQANGQAPPAAEEAEIDASRIYRPQRAR